MKKKGLIFVLLVIFAVAFVGCGNGTDGTEEPQTPEREAATLNVSAAASLTDVFEVIAAEYANQCDDNILFNFGGSGALQKQIEEGAPCDLFVSAAQSNMDALETGGLIDSASRVDLVGNTLTLIASAEKKDVVTIDALTTDAVASIAIGEVETVPAGKYAQQSFTSLGIWDELQPKFNFAKDVRAVLQYVDTGNVDCGLVYRTDAMLLETGVIIADMPEDSYDAVVYPAAITTDAAEAEAAAEFLAFLDSDYAKGVFEEYGFKVITKAV